MKKFFKSVLLVTVAAILLLSAACGKKPAGNTVKGPEGPLPDVIEKIYTKKDMGEIALATITQDMMDFTDPEVLKMYTGTDDTSAIKEIAVSEAMVGAIPYSLVLARVNDESKATEIAQTMFDNIDTRKWLCVEADDLKVAVCGDTVMLIMIGSQYAETATSQEIVDAFESVCGGSLTTVIE